MLVKHCQQGFGVIRKAPVNKGKSSDLIKKSDIMSLVQSNPQESNSVLEIGFDDCIIDP